MPIREVDPEKTRAAGRPIAGDRGDRGTRRRMDIRGQSGQQFEGVDMRRPDYGEMATVQRCKLGYPEPLAGHDH
jgi:hypothetical protein